MDGYTVDKAPSFADFLREVGEEHAATRSRIPAAPASQDNWRKLFKAVMPIEGESLRGLIYRACSLNGLPNSWGLLKWLGLNHRNRVIIAEDANIAPDELAYAVGVAEKEVEVRRYDDLGANLRSFFGLKIPSNSLEASIRRFAPEAFRADAVKVSGEYEDTDPGLRMGSYHRATWELRDIPFCLQHWDMLHDTCWCEPGGVVQRWTRTATHIHECDLCGDPLANLESFFVPDDMRPALSILRALVDPIEAVRSTAAISLPEAIRNADRSRIFALIVWLTRAIDPAAAEHPIEQPRLRLQALWQACDAVTNWPHAIKTVAWAPETSISIIASITKAWANLTCDNLASGAGGWKSDEQDAHTIIGIGTAAKTYPLTPKILRWAHEENRLTQHHRMHGQRLLPAFDTRELTRFSDEWRSRVSLKSLPYEFGISLHGAEQLVALGIIAADAPAMPGTGLYCTFAAVDDFMNAIEAAAASGNADHQNGVPIDNLVALNDAMAWVTGRAKPYGPAIELLLAGKVPFAIYPGAHFAESIMIPAEHIEIIAALDFNRADFSHFEFAERINQRDALEILNITAGYKGIRILDALPPRGERPKTFLIREVEMLARDFVTLPEIAMRLDIPIGRAYYYLRNQDKPATRPGLWDRKILDEIPSRVPSKKKSS